MKELLIFIISIIILLILFDMFCSNRKLTNFTKFIFASLVVFTTVSFLTKFITNLGDVDALQGDKNENANILIDEQIDYLESIIENRLEIEKGKQSEVVIEYVVDEGGRVEYSSINVYLTECENELKNEIEKIVKEYLDCQVNVYV